MNRIAVIGGGVVGLMSAYYLNKHNFDITIIDKSDLLSSCSTGNAGLIVPSHFVPLSSPGMVYKGIKWIFKKDGPFNVSKKINSDLINWGWNFYRHCNLSHVKYSEQPLLLLNQFSRDLYLELNANKDFNFGLKNDGVLMLCKNEKIVAEEIKKKKKAVSLGLKVEILNKEEINKIENCKVDAETGILYKSDSHLSPDKLINQLISFLKNKKVNFRLNTEITDFNISNNKINKLVYNNTFEEFDQVLLCAGALSGKLAKKLKLKIPVQPGKGYSYSIKSPKIKPKFPALLIDSKTAVTPTSDLLRIAGFMEIGAFENSVNLNKIKSIIKSVEDFYPEIKINLPEKEFVWAGLRPCSPDGLPYIGKSKVINNLFIATGHSMMGLSLGPATGKLIEELITGEKLSQNILPFNPERFN